MIPLGLVVAVSGYIMIIRHVNNEAGGPCWQDKHYALAAKLLIPLLAVSVLLHW